MKIININNKHYQECDVVMLPTDKKQSIIIQKRITNKLKTSFSNIYQLRNNVELYILSTEEIKEGDWVYENNLNQETKIYQIEKRDNRLMFFRFRSVPIWLHKNQHNCKKIIATTDSSLTNVKIIGKIPAASQFTLQCIIDSKKILLQIPQQFIEYFISEYNKGNVISKVLVEVELYHGINTSIAEINAISGDDSMNWKGVGDYRDYKIKLSQTNEIFILTE
jgi:hypothetical protein